MSQSYEQWVKENTIHVDNNGVTTIHDHRSKPPGHSYKIGVLTKGTIPIDFQNGPVKEHGVNGITSEALLAVLIHRTKILNDNFPCDENKRAISYMENALALFEQRTKDRMARNVEGTNAI